LSYDAIVIGAGTNGLVAAAVLARAGKHVLLLDENDEVGGKLRSIEFAPGFRATPFAQDPGWLPPSVARAVGIKAPAQASAPAPLTVAIPEGEFLPLFAQPTRAAEAIRRYSAKDASAWGEFTARLARQAGFLERVYQQSPIALDPRSPREALALAGLALAFRRLGRADMTALLRTLPMSVEDLLDDEFECEPLKAAIGSGGVQYLQQGPRSGGTAFALLHHLVGAPAGAMRRTGQPNGIVVALEDAARRQGVTIRTSLKVERILVKDEAVTGVVLDDDEEIGAPVVASSASPSQTLLGLIDPVWLDPEFLLAIRNIKYRGCTAFVLYALDALPESNGLSPETLTGIITLTPTTQALERAYDAAKYGRVSERPHVELSIPNLDGTADAPEGKHVLVARVQYAPYRLHQAQWDDSRRDALGAAATTAIASALPGFAERVLHRAVLAPPDLETRFGLSEGSAYQGELTLDQVLFMRPIPGWSRYRMPIDGLYLFGSGTHPGGGIVGASGLLAAREILRAER
jgi:phytoene dehydrogenase-like protein